MKSMMGRFGRFGAAFAALMLGAAAGAQAQDYPNKPVRIVLPFAAGGSTDTIARALGQKLGDATGQSFVIENRPGAAGAIASELVARAPNDGYTLLLATTSTHAVLPHLNPRLPYDPQRDFAPVGMLAKAANVLMVSPTLPVNSVKELIERGRAASVRYNFASSGNGTITHLIGEMFSADARMPAVHVPYRTGVQALPDITSGQITFAFDSIVWALPQAKAGKVKALAVTSAQRSALAPDLPTVAESGLPGFDAVTWFGLMAPAGTPQPVLARLGAEIEKALASADLRERLLAQGVEPSWSGPAPFTAFIKQDSDRWAALIRKLGIKLD